MFCEGGKSDFEVPVETKHSMHHILYKSALLIQSKIDPVGVLGFFLH